MDIKNIILKTRKYNLHSHTQFCDGRADMQTMAAAAVDCGMLYYGFTPHSPIPIESPCNMSVDSVNKYFDEIEIIRQKPEFHTCRFYAGMEVDYLGDSWGPSNEYFRHQPLDYTIGSVHFIPTQDGDYIDIDGHPDRFKDRMRECFRNDIEYVIHTFYQQTAAMIIAGGFDILGHFDKISHNASCYKPGITDSNFYKSCLDSVIQLILDRKICIELNTKARKEHGFFFPSEELLRILVDGGIDIVVNSDAHYPDRITASRSEAFEILDRIHEAKKA